MTAKNLGTFQGEKETSRNRNTISPSLQYCLGLDLSASVYLYFLNTLKAEERKATKGIKPPRGRSGDPGEGRKENFQSYLVELLK